MFDGPEYASYLALCRELRLEREWEDGDFFVDVHVKHVYGPDMHGRHVPFGDTEYADRDSVWLPRLDQWLAMLEEAGISRFELDFKSRQISMPTELGYAQQFELREAKPASVEEAAARLWMAVTGRTVTSG